MSMVSIEIPQEVIHATRMSPVELKRELAVHLYREGKLSFGISIIQSSLKQASETKPQNHFG
jgi:predicted HTH domain antitoxin